MLSSPLNSDVQIKNILASFQSKLSLWFSAQVLELFNFEGFYATKCTKGYVFNFEIILNQTAYPPPPYRGFEGGWNTLRSPPTFIYSYIYTFTPYFIIRWII